MDLLKFNFKEVLCVKSAEKVIVVLGTVSEMEGEAILVISPKTPNPKDLQFEHLTEIFHNDIYSRFDAVIKGEYEIQTIFPANDKHKDKYKQKKMILIEETADEYKNKEQQLLEKQLKHIGWVRNILEGTAEAERVMFKNQDFVILPDFKCSNLNDVESFHLLVIFSDENLHSIRSLRGKHIALLKTVKEVLHQLLKQKLNLEKGTCRFYFHYQPTFQRLHIHVTNLASKSSIALVERAHLLETVISNLQICDEYYCRATLMIYQQK